jgi:hypothetical protein
MTLLTDVWVGHKWQHAVINYYMTPCLTDKGVIEWTDENNHIAKHQAQAKEVEIYVVDEYDKTECKVMRIRAADIKKLSKLILDIEKNTSEEAVDF